MEILNSLPGPQTASLVASRLLFKNNSGINFNIYGKMSTHSAQRRSKITEYGSDENNLSNGELHEVKNNIERDIIKEIQSKMEEYINSEHATNRKKNGKVIQKRLVSSGEDRFLFHKHIPEISEVLTDHIRRLAQTYYNGAYIKPFEVKLYRNFHVPSKDVEPGTISSRWHQDGDYTDILKIFINISDVSEKDGPFHIVPRQDTISLMKNYKHQRGVPDEIVRNNANIIKATGEAGTTLIGNTNQCLHRAGVPEEGCTRDLLQIKLIPSGKPLPEDWLKKAVEVAQGEANRPPNTILK
jgi:hypothetical protein